MKYVNFFIKVRFIEFFASSNKKNLHGSSRSLLEQFLFLEIFFIFFHFWKTSCIGCDGFCCFAMHFRTCCWLLHAHKLIFCFFLIQISLFRDCDCVSTWKRMDCKVGILCNNFSRFFAFSVLREVRFANFFL